MVIKTFNAALLTAKYERRNEERRKEVFLLKSIQVVLIHSRVTKLAILEWNSLMTDALTLLSPSLESFGGVLHVKATSKCILSA